MRLNLDSAVSGQISIQMVNDRVYESGNRTPTHSTLHRPNARKPSRQKYYSVRRSYWLHISSITAPHWEREAASRSATPRVQAPTRVYERIPTAVGSVDVPFSDTLKRRNECHLVRNLVLSLVFTVSTPPPTKKNSVSASKR